MIKKILIVGGVAGGASCATRARRLNEKAEIKIFEKGPYVSFANCGLPYYVGEVIPDLENLIVASPEMFKDWFNIEVKLNHEVLSIDRKNKKIKIFDFKKNVEYHEKYDSLVLAPGSSPKTPKIEGVNLNGIFTLRDIKDSINIKKYLKNNNVKKAVILGGGFIGIELSENLVRLGIKVSIVEATDSIISNLDKEMSYFVKDYIKKMGIDINLKDGVNKFEKNDKIEVHLDSEKKIKTDVVLIAAGVKPESNLARKAGLSLGQYGGIEVDKYMQTSDVNIWAVGDAIEVKHIVSNQAAYIPLAGMANRQGRIAAESIISRKKDQNFSGFLGSIGTNVCGFFDITFASTGLNEKQLKTLSIEDKTFEYEKIHVYGYNHAEYYPNAKKITLKLIFSIKDGRIFGAQALGVSDVEKRIDIISTAIRNNLTVFDISESELCYAPQYGTAKDIINIAGMVASNVCKNYFRIAHWDICLDNKTILDVREDFIYNRNHVKGAINIPLENLRERMYELEKDKEIFIYCLEGKRSYFACRILSQNGYKVKSFSGGYIMYEAYNKQAFVKV